MEDIYSIVFLTLFVYCFFRLLLVEILRYGVAFSEKCERIGYGGGFYDTTLKYKNKNARTLGIAFDFQIVEEGFSEPFDERLDAVATPERIIINH